MVYRLARQNLSRRQVVDFNKQVHAIAHQQGTTALRAAWDNFDSAYRSTYECPCCSSRSSRGNHKNGVMFVRHVEVDDGELELRDEDVYDFNIDFRAHEPPRRNTDMTVSLLDIAKPAKRSRKGRGLHQPMLAVHRLNPSLVNEDAEFLDEDLEGYVEIDDLDDFSFFDDDWEEVYDEQYEPCKSSAKLSTQARRSYSSVLRGHDR